MTSRKNAFYLPWVDGLRAIAALSVVVHHGPTLRSLPNFKNYLGWFGVDLFLVLSAFLLARLLQLEYAATGAIRVKDFFIRRALRIWPLYFLFVTSCFVYGLYAQSAEPKILVGWFLSFATFTQNIANMIHEGGRIPFTGQLWTIGLEEQAYLLMPILIGLYLKNENRKTLAKFIAVALVGFLVVRLSVVLLGRIHPYVYASPLRADTFLCGIYLALGTRIGATENKSVWVAGVAFLALICLAAICIHIDPPGVSLVTEVIGYPMMGVICCLLIAAIDKSTFAARLLGTALMRRLGKLSYGIYVFHVFGLWVADRLFERIDSFSPWVSLGITLAITIGLAEISYRVLEKPFLTLKERFTVVQNRPA
ncbi:acyltransferase family protein [Paraburkholderia caribensis]|uniref:acyltransferase family protein n=1 Tax=Paraburkholderia caribensis TaxID=75105 RepID=UPI00285C65CA|nr:acyltransferase [Paraburkholderia caribensis]MDR6380070.1 peptidoglycan/LPS O-acetylase OafA/YrhL [Paraburkholderia caribensis]